MSVVSSLDLKPFGRFFWGHVEYQHFPFFCLLLLHLGCVQQLSCRKSSCIEDTASLLTSSSDIFAGNLPDFLQRCQKKKSEVMLCPRCSSIFDKKAAEHIQDVRAANKRRENVDLRHDPRRASQRGSNQEKRPLTFRPPTNVPVDTWYKTSGRKRPSEERWHSFDVPRGSSLTQKKEPQVAAPKVTQVSSNCKGKNPMSRSQWRRYQR